MPASIPFNPNIATVGQGLFSGASAEGLVQGTAFPDPATRYALRGGILSEEETIPMWGGVGIYELVPGASGGPSAALGPVVGRATGLSSALPLAGFSVFDQAYGMINTPQSPVQLSASGMQVMSYRLGSGARIAVACDPNLIDLAGNPISGPVSWDFENQMLVPYASTTVSSAVYTADATVSSGTYNETTGVVDLTIGGNHGLLPGDEFTLTGMTGTGSIADLDGTFTAIAGTTGATLMFVAQTGLTLTITGGTLATGSITLTTAAPHGLLPGDTFELSSLTGSGSFAGQNGEQVAAVGTTGSTLRYLTASGLTLTITGGNVGTGGILPVSVLDVQVGNCQIVEFDSTTGFATWNFNGSAAVIQI